MPTLTVDDAMHTLTITTAVPLSMMQGDVMQNLTQAIILLTSQVPLLELELKPDPGGVPLKHLYRWKTLDNRVWRQFFLIVPGETVKMNFKGTDDWWEFKEEALGGPEWEPHRAVRDQLVGLITTAGLTELSCVWK